MKLSTTLLALLTLFCLNSFAQKNLSDTSMALGVLIDDTFVGTDVSSYCSIGIDKTIARGQSVIISGIYECKKSYSTEVAEFYQIVYKEKLYYIEKKDLATVEDPFGQISRFTLEQSERFRERAIYISNVLLQADMDKALRFLNSCKAKGLTILSFGYSDESEYTEGTSASIEVYNPTAKTVKYIWFTLVGYNPVGDKVIDPKRRTSAITMKAVGPIKPEGTGKYNFDYVWFTDMVETAKISSIKIQYMDGTFKTILAPKEVTLNSKLYSFLFDGD